jgi:LysM repeat protein
MLTQISTKISVALVIGAAVAGVACSSKDKNYSPGTAYPAGANAIPAEASPPGSPQGLVTAAEPVAPAEPLAPLTPEEIGPTINYTVKKGDSLWLIAKDHKSSVSLLKRVNQLTSDNIQVGHVLRIPSGKGQIGTAPAASPAPVASPAPAAPATPSPTLGTPAAAPKTTPAVAPTSKFKRPPTSADPPTPGSEIPAAPKPGKELKIQD